MADHTPRVTVLTAVHNGERYLDQTIASIMAQTYADFEYILIDDGSTDSSPAILAQCAARDARIRVLHNDRPLNPAGALNRGLDAARGEYVANLDHDDLAYPSRLAEQVAFLDAHPAIGVVGAQVMTIDAAGRELRPVSYPTRPALAQWLLMFYSPLNHSAWMLRRGLLAQVGSYSTAHWASADYELLTRLARVTELCNLPTTLTAYRHSSLQISSLHSRAQYSQVLLFLQAMLVTQFGLDKRARPMIAALLAGVRGVVLPEESQLRGAGALLDQLQGDFVRKRGLTPADAHSVRLDCAHRFLCLAYLHRHRHRTASRELLARALAHDPQLWQRSHTRPTLRQLRVHQRQAANPTVINPTVINPTVINPAVVNSTVVTTPPQP